jgi:hypothetical protein
VAVVLPNAVLTARAHEHPFVRDKHGTPVAGPIVTTVRGPYPGAVTQPAGGEPQNSGPWHLRVDARCHELRIGDEITEPSTARVWVVREAKLCTVPGVPDVDHIAVSADLDPPVVP